MDTLKWEILIRADLGDSIHLECPKGGTPMIFKRFTLILFTSIIAVMALAAKCKKDPPPPIGKLVVVIRSIPTDVTSEFNDIERLLIEYDTVEVVWAENPGDPEEILAVGNHGGERLLLDLENADEDYIVGEYQVPVGHVVQFRVHPTEVVIQLRDGTFIDMPIENPELPSWEQTGWKITSESGLTFQMYENEITGMRGLLHFEDRFVRPRNPHGIGWKIKPTIDAELFDVNPPDGTPGVFLDQVDVLLIPGTSRSVLDRINSEIDATILIEPILTSAYRVKIPASISLDDALHHYNSQPDIQTASPAVNYALDLDYHQEAYNMVRMLPAWTYTESVLGKVGDRNVTVAVIDCGIRVRHPDLWQNVFINNGELPVGLYDSNGNGIVDEIDIAYYDTDDDGVISFVDLNSDSFRGTLPPDVDRNGVITAWDIWADEWRSTDPPEERDLHYLNHRDDDGNGYDDDITGYDIENNDPTPWPELGNYHGTWVGEVCCGDGNNGEGIAGVSWNVSLVPLRATTGIFPDIGVSHISFYEAVYYAEINNIDIVNTSMGWHFASENAPLRGAVKSYQLTRNVPQVVFNEGVAVGEDWFRVWPWFDTSTGEVISNTLYVFSAGNVAVDNGNPNILHQPEEFMQAVMPDNVISVGGVDATDSNHPHSCYGSNVDIWAPYVWEMLTYCSPYEIEIGVGTSFSAPAVSGSAALVLSLHPELKGEPATIKEYLIETAAPTVEVVIDGRVMEEHRPLLDVFSAVAAP